MSSVHNDKGWLVIVFRLNGKLVRLYPGVRATRDGKRAPVIKQIRDLVQMRQWGELAMRFPRCKLLQAFASQAPDRTTFKEASERFLAHQAHSNRPATVRFYETILRAHVWPTSVADKPIRLVSTSDVVAVYGPIHQRGQQAQAANVRRTVSAVFNWARRERGNDDKYLVVDNPVSRTKHPGVQHPAGSIDPFTPEEIREILRAARVGWERRLVTVALGAGLDPGENFGLKIHDLDFAARQIQVRQRFSRFGVGAPKNARRARDVDMSEPVYRALREQVGDIELRSPWLWARGPLGQPHNPQNFSRRNWPAILIRAGVKRRAFYQCRHTFATLLLRRGADWQYVADQMGHANLVMLQTVYWRWRPGTTPKPEHDILAEVLNER